MPHVYVVYYYCNTNNVLYAYAQCMPFNDFNHYLCECFGNIACQESVFEFELTDGGLHMWEGGALNET